ncbi:3-(3-hydroxy-phenyl)propionate 3-hydroxycinnamic acid hydroxylase [Fusarium agapanthi]|uniref:3-(3-hydroxy-phenyl)propionate 3-hydroxycinnamic acid hydroxylase n=1 Tax=Fusarium agapanthi TaxID=1803897 RepID=A0A9P5B4C5_9HYPO|nr:3-(3-hydroxy-phenyl)propionate 3-hydroxycinnamic acid hydroxylase [Fusarium agapanthi]
MVVKLNTTVAVIGAGPVGLFTALLLAQSGVKVAVIEKGARLNQSPRAVAYFPAVLDEFKKAGILQEVIDQGEVNAEGCVWRTSSGQILAAVDPPPNSPHFAVCLSQPELSEILYKRLLETGNAEVVFNHAYQRHEQSESSVLFWIKSLSGEDEIAGECQYLIGADGGRSQVRKDLGVELKGFTWESLQFVAVNFQYELSELGWKKANFIVDPVSWGIIVKRGKGTSWRFATGVTKRDIEAETLDGATIKVVKERLMSLLPGDTSRIHWEAMSPYKVHQRCATTFRKGNVLLAGDAAHLNSPVGGLGLTTGLLDAAHLAESLRQMLLEKADPVVLDQLRSQDPKHIKQRDEFFAKLNTYKDIATTLQVGLPDFALSSTSKTVFSTYEEVTWFISVTKFEDWTDERFKHEYKVVHANMTRQGKESGAPTLQYTQYANLHQEIPGVKRPGWNYVTSLVFPCLFLVHAGLQDPGYRATAGSHKFCRLDQQGCLTRKISEYSKEGDSSSKPSIRALLFHERHSATDEYSENWVQERAVKLSAEVESDSRAYGYVLWQDVTPKNTSTLFRDSLFEPGNWHNFKAVEAFDFLHLDSADAFLQEHMVKITEDGKQTITVVASKPDVIF